MGEYQYLLKYHPRESVVVGNIFGSLLKRI